MGKVSEEGQAALAQLVAWEVLGAREIDPKSILRQTPLADLSIISTNLKRAGSEVKNFACVSMVEAELLYKTGLLKSDWGYERRGKCITLTYSPVSFPNASLDLQLLEVGAKA